MSWLSRLLRRRRLDGELEREVSFHLEQHTRDLITAGLSPEDAQHRARREFGTVAQVKEETREARGTRWIEDWWSDTRYALRGLRRSRGFAAAAILTLALGIGANTAVFSVIRSLLLQTLPVARPDQLFVAAVERQDGPDDRFSGPALLRYQAASAGQAELAAMTGATRMYLTIGESPEPVVGQLVSGNWFAVLRVAAERGRLLSESDDRSAEPAAVVSYDFWTRRLNSDPQIVGRPLRVNGATFTVVGVAEPTFRGVVVGRPTEVFLTLAQQQAVRYFANASLDNADVSKAWLGQEGIRWLGVLGRHTGPEPRAALLSRLDAVRRDHLTSTLATADSATRAFLQAEHLTLGSAARGISPLRDQFANPLLVLMVTVGVVLLIACANLAGLLLARSAARTHEIAVRVSLGARGWRLVRQVLTESVTLALLGGAASLLVAFWGSRALLAMATTVPGSVGLAVPFDWPLLGFAAGISLLAGVAFGVVPAWRVSRTDLYDSFKGAGRIAGDRRGREWPMGRLLVVGQVALSLALVVIASIFVKSTQKLVAIDPGYDRESVLAVRLDTRAVGYPSAQLPGLYQRLLDAARSVPGVRSASLSVHGLAAGGARTSTFAVPGKVRAAEWDADAQVGTVTEDYFATTGIRLLAGRSFTRADQAGAPRVAIVTAAMAKRFFDTDNPVGLRFGFDDTNPTFEVVGVVQDIRPNDLREAPVPMAFFPLAQESGDAYIYSLEARITGNPVTVGRELKQAVAAVDRALPVREVVTVGELLSRTVQQELVVSRLTGTFGILAALLAAIGLYGMLAYSVTRRTNEMGVRLALGASPAAVRGLVMRDALRLVAAGLVGGGLLLVPALKAIESMVFGMSPRDPTAIGLATLALVGAGLAASWLPAWRAARINPVTALRRD